MAEVTRTTSASPQQVFDVLADGWSYSGWVVGASRVRGVDPSWPERGARIHHSAGVWPLVLDDSTHVLECEPSRRLVLEARGWPVGQATVDFTLEPDGRGCRVQLVEDVSTGPGLLVPEPVRRALLVPRNAETLKRLCLLAEGRAGTPQAGKGRR